MANLLALDTGRLVALIGKLAKAGFTVEMAEALLDHRNSDLVRVPVDALRAALGTAAPTTLAQMITDAGFPPGRFNTDITEQHFPLGNERAYDATGLSLFGGDRGWSIAEVEVAIKPNGGRLEGLVRGLAYLKANPDALKDGPIIFPASSWVSPGGCVGVPYAFMDACGSWLRLYLDVRAHRWSRIFRFLVSGKASA